MRFLVLFSEFYSKKNVHPSSVHFLSYLLPSESSHFPPKLGNSFFRALDTARSKGSKIHRIRWVRLSCVQKWTLLVAELTDMPQNLVSFRFRNSTLKIVFRPIPSKSTSVLGFGPKLEPQVWDLLPGTLPRKPSFFMRKHALSSAWRLEFPVAPKSHKYPEGMMCSWFLSADCKRGRRKGAPSKKRQKSSKSVKEFFDTFRQFLAQGKKSSKSVKKFFDNFRAAPFFRPLLGGSWFWSPETLLQFPAFSCSVLLDGRNRAIQIENR